MTARARGVAIIAAAAGCAHAPVWQPPAPAVIVDRGTFSYALEGAASQPGGHETFAIADRPDGSHLIHGEVEFSRHGVTRAYAGTIALDHAWRPIDGTFTFGGSTVRLSREADKLVLRGTSASMTETTPSELFDGGGNFDMSVFLHPLCTVRGQRTMTLFPDHTIHVDASAATAEEAHGFPIHDQLILVSVSGDARYELACDGAKLVVIDAPGSLAVRPGYEALATTIARGLGDLR